MAKDEIQIQDLFDMEFLQKFQDNFARAVGIGAVTVDKDAQLVTRPTDWTDFCMKQVRGTAEGERRCIECRKNASEVAVRSGKPNVYE